MPTSSDSERLRELARTLEVLASSRALPAIAHALRSGARTVVGADGITFVMRDGRKVRYIEEDAISPLWKGLAFPIAQCVSGLAMLGCETIAIGDVFADARVPHEAYRPTFVKSMAMAPVGLPRPFAAIGAYWARPGEPPARDLAILNAMADAVAVAIEQIGLDGAADRMRIEALALTA